MIRYYKAKMAGPYHVEKGIPCQDEYHICPGNDGAVIAACADGLGSELRSDIGARIASQTAVEYCKELFTAEMSFPEIKKIMNNAFVRAYKAILTEATESGNSYDEYDTTLCLAIYHKGHVYFGQSGDSGLVVLLKDGNYVTITEQQRDEDGCVFPLCSGPEIWVFGEIQQPVSALMLMTDGVWDNICPPLLKDNTIKVDVALASKFLERAEEDVEEIAALEQAAFDYLENFPRTRLDDDKTIIVMYDTGIPAEKRSSEQLVNLDIDKIRREAYMKLYPYKANEYKSLVKEVQKCKDPEKSPSTDHLPELTCEMKLSPVQGRINSCQPEKAKNQLQQKQNVVLKDKKKNNCSHQTIEVPVLLLLLTASIIAVVMDEVIKKYILVACFGLFVICMLANSTVLLHIARMLFIVEYAQIISPVFVIVCAAFGALIGEIVGGWFNTHRVRATNKKTFTKMKEIFSRHPALFTILFSLLPLPMFEIADISAATTQFNRLKFYLGYLLSKLLSMSFFVWLTRTILACLQ